MTKFTYNMVYINTEIAQIYGNQIWKWVRHQNQQFILQLLAF